MSPVTSLNQLPSACLSFTELDTTSNFSFLKGGSHPEEIVKRAYELGYSAVGLADLNTLSGIVRAHFAAKELGIKALIGSRLQLLEELPLAPLKKEKELPKNTTSAKKTKRSSLELPFELLLYPSTKEAYESLSSLLSLGKLRANKGECWLRLLDLEDIPSELFAIIKINHLSDSRLEKNLLYLKNVFENLYLSLTKNYCRDERPEISALAKKLSIKTLASNQVLYHEPARSQLQDVLSCIRLGLEIKDAGFHLQQNSERYLKTEKEMLRIFSSYPEAVKNTQVVTEALSNFSIEELQYEYPEEICPRDSSPQEYLETITWHGAAERFPNGIPKRVRKLLNYEFQLIKELNYAKYFLTVYKIVAFARSKQILCQGRGAAANSAVCYCLGITAVDPSKTRLLVERFISKERGEPPDIDIDFEHERREEVIQYIYRTFSRRRAALVCEVVTYRMKSSLREVGKVLGLANDTIDNLQKLFYRRSSDDPVTDEDFRNYGLNPKDLVLKKTLELAKEIRGFPRHLSQHTGGFVISDSPLSNIVPIENASMPERTVIEWDKDDIELMGMLKIDVLGLGMLTCIRKGLELINQHKLSEELSLKSSNFTASSNTTDKTEACFSSTSAAHREVLLHTIPPEDPAVYEMLCQADTIGVFQVESRAQMNMLPRLKPRCFFDLVVEVAIVRPGPLQGGMVHPYLRRRAGREPITYPSEDVKEILGNTLGVPIFQEQIMELAVVAGGFTPGEADQLRRAIASWKRNKDKMRKYARKLMMGLLERGYSKEFAKQIFGQIKGFSEYGFPQSHAASFALLVYASSWIKLHHPEVFACALLNSQPMGFYQASQIIRDAEAHGVTVLPVDINHSEWDCTLEDYNSRTRQTDSSSQKTRPKLRLRLGFRMVKGLAKSEAELLGSLESYQFRTRGYKHPKEVWKKTNLKVSSLRALARADSFRSMELDRQAALWQLKALRDEELPLFTYQSRETSLEKPQSLSPLPSFNKEQHVLFDYEFTGHSLKAHPLSFYRSRLKAGGIKLISEFKSSANGCLLSFCGLSVIRQKPPTAKGVLFMTVEDETGLANIVFQPEVYKTYRQAIIDSQCLVFYGKVQKVESVINLLASRCQSLESFLSERKEISDIRGISIKDTECYSDLAKELVEGTKQQNNSQEDKVNRAVSNSDSVVKAVKINSRDWH